MKASILVVDDQETILLSTKVKLESQGFEVDTASGGEKALARIQEKSYDIVLLDVNMPVMNGVQVLEFITSKYPYSDVMMLTAFDDFTVASECLKKGAKDYLLKPIDLSELVLRINLLLRARASERAFSDLREFWQSTVLFDVFGSLRSVRFVLDDAVESMKAVLPEKEMLLIQHARMLNDRIVQTLRESVKVTELTEGSFLFGQAEIDLTALLNKIIDRYEPCGERRGIVLTRVFDNNLPHVKCDAERMEQVVNSIFESALESLKTGKTMNVTLSKSSIGLYGEPSNYVVCAIEYPYEIPAGKDLQTVLQGKELDLKNVDGTSAIGVFNLAISRRLVEAQGGSFLYEVKESQVNVKFALPLE